MFDLGIEKLMMIGAVALIVIGPEKLPRVARTVGTLLGKAQRYVADVKSEVNRSMELDELRKMKDTMQDAAREVQHDIRSGASDIHRQITGDGSVASVEGGSAESSGFSDSPDSYEAAVSYPEYRHPRKNWRLKQGATPSWYKARNGVRTRALSGAARVARFRPHRSN